LNSIKILCVDEYALMLMTIQHMLEFAGWQVEAARDGGAALAKLAGGERYDAIVLAEKLPDTDGLELLRRTRQMAHRRRTPVVLFASTNCEREAYLAGASAVLHKPDDIKLLTETVARCLCAHNPREMDWKTRRYLHRPGEYEWFACIKARSVYHRDGRHLANLDADGKTLRHPRTNQIIARECGDHFYTTQGELWGAVRESLLVRAAAQ
jgi:CheY-like chemotaxis protein